MAQVLLTHDDLRNRRRYLNARATLSELLRAGGVAGGQRERHRVGGRAQLGDNDNLAATVAALVDADALFIATDIDGLYSADPRTVPDARPLHDVPELSDPVLAMAGGAGSRAGTGGMRTKLEAAAKAGRLGIETYLFNGRSADVVRALAQDRLFGTRIHAARSREAARKHWLRHAPLAEGAIVVDAGAAQAMREGASLLPGGITAAEGHSGAATWCRCAGTRRRAASAWPAGSASTRPTTCAASPAIIRATSRPCSATTTGVASSIVTTWCCHDRFEGHPDERNRSPGARLP